MLATMREVLSQVTNSYSQHLEDRRLAIRRLGRGRMAARGPQSCGQAQCGRTVRFFLLPSYLSLMYLSCTLASVRVRAGAVANASPAVESGVEAAMSANLEIARFTS